MEKMSVCGRSKKRRREKEKERKKIGTERERVSEEVNVGKGIRYRMDERENGWERVRKINRENNE